MDWKETLHNINCLPVKRIVNHQVEKTNDIINFTLEACYAMLKLIKCFQIIAGVVNVLRFENRRAVQVRNISCLYTPNDTHVDLAIVKVNQPFNLIGTVQIVTLPPAGPFPPGIE